MQPEEGEQLAQQQAMSLFFETSSRNNSNVDSAFMRLACELKAQYQMSNQLDDFGIGDERAFHLGGSTTTSIGSQWRTRCCRSLN